MGDVKKAGERLARVDLWPDDLHAAWVAVPGGRWVCIRVHHTPSVVRKAARRWLSAGWQKRAYGRACAAQAREGKPR